MNSELLRVRVLELQEQVKNLEAALKEANRVKEKTVLLIVDLVKISAYRSRSGTPTAESKIARQAIRNFKDEI